MTLIENYLKIFETLNKKFLKKSKNKSFSKKIKKISITKIRLKYDDLIKELYITNDK